MPSPSATRTPATAPEPAIQAGDDPRHHAEVLSAVYDARMSGTRAPARPRDVIDDSWRRLLADGADPDRMARATPDPAVIDLDQERRASGLDEVVEEMTAGLDAVTTDGDNIVVVADRGGRVLWRSGSPRVLSRADRLGFVEGASWAEGTVGTNAIGTRARRGVGGPGVLRRTLRPYPPHVDLHRAPIRDARTGEVLGVVDVSVPPRRSTPRPWRSSTRWRGSPSRACARCTAAASTACGRSPHRCSRARGPCPRRRQPRVGRGGRRCRLRGPTVPPAGDRPRTGDAARPRLVRPRPAARGWLIRLADADGALAAQATKLVVDLCSDRDPSVRVVGPMGSWTQTMSPRHAEILYLLSLHAPDGRTAGDLAADLFGEPSRVVTVRAEMSRLRRQLSGLIAGSPYRFVDGLDVEVSVPADPARLLPRSTAPAIRRARMGT